MRKRMNTWHIKRKLMQKPFPEAGNPLRSTVRISFQKPVCFWLGFCSEYISRSRIFCQRKRFLSCKMELSTSWFCACGKTPTTPRRSTWACLRMVCLGDADDLLFHLLRIISPSASDGRWRGVLGEGPPLQRYSLRNAARICSRVEERSHVHTHACTLEYLWHNPDWRQGEPGTKCFVFFLLPWGTCRLVAVWKFVLKKLKFFFFPQRARLFWAVIFFKCSLVGMNPCKNENQTISYRAWEGQGRALCCSALWGFPSGSHLPRQILPRTRGCQAPGSCSQNPKSISRAVNRMRLLSCEGLLSWPGILGAARSSIFTAAHLILKEVG